jgi:hypothetical protein
MSAIDEAIRKFIKKGAERTERNMNAHNKPFITRKQHETNKH